MGLHIWQGIWLIPLIADSFLPIIHLKRIKNQNTPCHLWNGPGLERIRSIPAIQWQENGAADTWPPLGLSYQNKGWSGAGEEGKAWRMRGCWAADTEPIVPPWPPVIPLSQCWWSLQNLQSCSNPSSFSWGATRGESRMFEKEKHERSLQLLNDLPKWGFPTRNQVFCPSPEEGTTITWLCL